MKTKKIASIYSIFMGVSIIGMWIMFYLSNSIPEILTRPIELGMHVLAEIVTAILLIVGGIGILSGKEWGLSVYLVSTGMLMYTLVMSPGYFLQNGETGFVIMFSVFLILAVVFMLSILRNQGARN